MGLYLLIRQGGHPLAEFSLDRKLTFSKRRRIEKPVLEGDKVFLPAYPEIDSYIGDPHAAIEPLSDNSALYQVLFTAETGSEQIIPEFDEQGKRRGTDYLRLNEGDEIVLGLDERVGPRIVTIGNYYNICITDRPTLEEYWKNLRRE